ncbi:MAG: DUF418 domain-containing protein [Lysobacter sp.]|nr:DUF418 domain-containing protein [Lysobacter sp.]
MTHDPALQPVAAGERIETMDVLRGWALLGILLMNIEAFVGPMMAAITGLDPALTGADRIADAAVYILVQGKFYLLFSLLFGMGFAVMMTRTEASGRPFVAPYLRRSFALLAIGLVHLIVVWQGDILTVYALIALVLLALFRHVPTGQLPWWALGSHALAWLFSAGPLLMGAMARMVPGAATEVDKVMQAEGVRMQAQIEAERLVLGSGSFLDALAHRAGEAPEMLFFVLFAGGQILGMFLLGMWFVRSGAITDPARFPRLYAWLRWCALPVGLAMMLVSFRLMPTADFSVMSFANGFATLLSMIAALLMCLGYVAWIERGLSTPLAPLLRVVAPAGRMALTNYLMQSLVCTFIFYGYGLGWFERLPRAWQVPFAIALFTLQVLLSRWWLVRFRYGPMEWLWRAATWLRWPAMRRAD